MVIYISSGGGRVTGYDQTVANLFNHMGSLVCRTTEEVLPENVEFLIDLENPEILALRPVDVLQITVAGPGIAAER